VSKKHPSRNIISQLLSPYTEPDHIPSNSHLLNHRHWCHLAKNWNHTVNDRIVCLLRLCQHNVHRTNSLTCPCPREMVWVFSPNPLSSANLSSAAIGSAPGDSTKTSGAEQDESAKELGRSKVGGSINFWPIFSTMNCWTAGTILSGRRVRSTTSLSSPVRASNGAGKGNVSGDGLS